MVEIKIKNLVKTYNEAKQPTLKKLNFKVKDGEFLTIVGPSGCGKSTLLRMISGLEDITSGEIFVGKKLINDVAPQKRNIAMVFQDYALYPHMNVYDNMAFNLKIKKMNKKEIRNRITRASNLLGLKEYLERRPAQLSGGQRQRVALGRAMVRNPNLFLLDEPLSNLDAKLRVDMRTVIARLHQYLKVTTIYVTHDQTEAMTLGDRILLLNDGVVQQIGTPDELYNNPKNIFVAQFIGSPSMNILRGELNDGFFFNDRQKIDLNAFLPKAVPNTFKTFAFGFRPEDAYLIDNLKNQQFNFNLKNYLIVKPKFELSEYLGEDTETIFNLAQQKISIKIQGNFQGQPNKEYQIGIPKEKLYYFNTENNLNINPRN